MARRTEDCSLLGGAWFQVPVEERAGRTGARAAVLQRSVASHKSPAQRSSTSWASQGGFTTTAQRARGRGIWSALCRALGHPELCQLVSSHTKWEGRRGARGPLGPAFSVSGKLVSWSVTETCLGQQTLSSCSPRGRVPFPPSRAALLSSGTLRARLLVHGHGAERGQRPFFGRTALRSVTTHAPERDARAVLVVSRPQPRRTGRAGGVCRVTRPPLSHWVLFLVRCSGY